MYRSAAFYLFIVSFTATNGNIFNFEKFQNYSTTVNFLSNQSNNELWQGIFRDCHKNITLSCIKRNAYSYLEQSFMDRDNITVFDGLSLTRNKLDYDSSIVDNQKYNLMYNTDGNLKNRTITHNFNENNFEEINKIKDNEKDERQHGDEEKEEEEEEEEEENEYLSPLEEITYAMRKKTVRFLATRDYKLQLPTFIGEGFSLKISPREIDNTGVLIRLDFDNPAVEHRGRLFLKKIKKQIQNKLLVVLFVLILLVKIIKLKFMFIIPFLFGIGTAKKLFLKLLLFFVPAFSHVFKLCSSYYSSHATKYHHHHHKVAHHHHHIPIPVPVPYTKPVYYDHPPSHSHILDDEFPGLDYPHPHIQYRKDIEELKEWGIEPYNESYDRIAPHADVVYPGPTTSTRFSEKLSPSYLHPQNLAYSDYGPSLSSSTSIGSPHLPAITVPVEVIDSSLVGPVKASIFQPTKQQNFNSNDFSKKQHQQLRPVFNQYRPNLQQKSVSSKIRDLTPGPAMHKLYDDEFYGPIVEKLDDIFSQMKFVEENCRERLVCNMYKNPTFYSPHSNIVSNELSRDPQELQQVKSISTSSQRFLKYLNAARLGQDGGDCLKAFHCTSNF